MNFNGVLMSNILQLRARKNKKKEGNKDENHN